MDFSPLTRLGTGLLIAACLSTTPTEASAQKRSKKKSATPTSETPQAEEPKKIMEVTKSSVAYPGLFTLYQDTLSGETYMLVKEEQLNQDYIYFNHVADGVLDAGYFRGAYGSEGILRFSKHFDKIELIGENTAYYFDEGNPLKRSETANINRPILASQKIEAVSNNGKAWLIKVDGLLLNESLTQIKPSPNPKQKPGSRFDLGSLSKDKTKISQVRSYPENTDVEVEYVFENPYPMNYGSPAVTDGRVVSVKVQHSFIEVPDNNFQARFDDPRVGYFTTQVTDMTSPAITPYRDLVHRWHLEKKDPAAAISEPVEPITWWIENTTPHEFRPTIKAAVLEWNKAFEQAGFKNAVVVKEQADDADWDAGDIRYNVLRWTSSPQPPFGGYGPSFVNPRTGQILGADVMLEYVFVTNRLQVGRVFESAALGLEQSRPISPTINAQHFCNLSEQLHYNNLLGLSLAKAGTIAVEEDELIKQSLYYLALHEVGHTLGLNHNMKASQMTKLSDIHNQDLARQQGLTGSVMDYPAINISNSKEDQGLFYTMRPGPYDMWAIEFAYSPALEDADAEHARLSKLLARSTQPELTFGNDADDMRSPGKAIDPRVMIGDMSGDAIGYATERIELINQHLVGIKDRLAEEDQSYQQMLNAYFILTSEQRNQLSVASRYIGGVYVDRAFHNQPGASQPFTPVSKADQKRAMATLSRHAFAPNAFEVPADLLPYLQAQRRGFNHFGQNEDPQIHARVLAIQKNLLDHLMHPDVWQRIVDTHLYGNAYSLQEMTTDLTNAIFAIDARSSVNSRRQNLQQEYTDRLIAIMNASGGYDHVAQATAFSQLKRIQEMPMSGADASTRAHRDLLKHKIKMAMEGQRG